MTAGAPIERLLRRDRAIIVVALVLLCLLAWLYLFTGAGMNMDVRALSGLAPSSAPTKGHHDMAAMPGMGAGGWTAAAFAIHLAMWWVMMVAMMLPAAAPTILLYATVHRGAQAQGRLDPGAPPAGAFLAGYLLIWLLFSLAATVLQWALEWQGILSAMTMGSQSRWLTAGLLLAAGLYQLTPLKQACLAGCRSPAQWLARHWRPGASGALRLGIRHGAYCVGCCWLLMAILFAGGVMNLAWIALLALVVMAEKLLPGGPWIARGLGTALVAGAAVVLMA